jgi:hypothetical protein
MGQRKAPFMGGDVCEQGAGFYIFASLFHNRRTPSEDRCAGVANAGDFVGRPAFIIGVMPRYLFHLAWYAVPGKMGLYRKISREWERAGIRASVK